VVVWLLLWVFVCVCFCGVVFWGLLVVVVVVGCFGVRSGIVVARAKEAEVACAGRTAENLQLEGDALNFCSRV
jgi:hypothetical protein